jgi:hypothetical protein
VKEIEAFVMENSEGVNLSQFWGVAGVGVGVPRFAMSQGEVERIIEACERQPW